MRLGISSSLEHSSADDWAQKLKELGCRSVVFPADCNADDASIEAYVNAAAAHDLQIAEVGIWRNAIALDAKEQQAAMDYSIRQLKLADKIKARCCVNVIGSVGPRWDGAYPDNFTQNTWDRAVRMIQEVIDEAKPQHTFFTIEPMPWMYPTSPEEYLQMAEDVKRDQFGVHMDVINMINTPERYFFPQPFLEHCFDLLGSRIRSCHLKDILLGQEFTFRLQECACGEGTFCLERYAELANAADPDMPMIIEHLHSDREYVSSVGYVLERLKNFL